MTDQTEPQVVDVDELARGKVQEIEALLSGDAKNSCHTDTFNSWFSVLKQIITAADLHRTNDKNDKDQSAGTHQNEVGESIYADYSDDNEQFNAVNLTEQFATNSVKWTIRVQAFKIVHRLVRMFADPVTNNHFMATRTNPSRKASAALSRHLPDLVRLAFVAATSPYDELKMQGFEMFQFLIDHFAHVEEREFPGHSILEQYRTQFFSAVKPAFNLDAPPYITAVACRVCSLWICQGLEKSANDLVRACQLMSVSIEKLHKQSVNHNSKLYTESELEQERVEILGAWAQLYIVSMEYKLNEHQRLFNCLSKSDSMILQELVGPQLSSLTNKWWEALKDYALLIMPAPRLIGVSHDNESVYTREVALELFEPTWPKIVFALSIRLCAKKYPLELAITNNNSSRFPIPPVEESNERDNRLSVNDEHNSQCNPTMNDDIPKYVKFLSGIIMKDFYRCQLVGSDKPTSEQQPLCDSSVIAIKSLNILLSESEEVGSVILSDFAISQEFYCSIYSSLVRNTRDTQHRQLVKETLDLLFKSTLRRVVKNTKYIHHGIARSIGLLMKSMKDIEVAVKEKSVGHLEVNKTHFSVRLNNLIALIMASPTDSMDEVQLREALIFVFQEMLQFEPDPSVGCSLLEHLRILYESMAKNHVSYFNDQLFSIQLTRISNLTRANCEPNNRVNLKQVEIFSRAMRSAINSVDTEETKRKMVNSYVETFLNTMNQLDDSDRHKLEKQHQDLVDELLLNELVHLNKSLTNFDNLLTSELVDRFKSAVKKRQEAKDKIKTPVTTTNKRPVNVNVKTKAAPNKITLRADFSNFYTK